jgi:rod shape determining protein RodA
MAAKPELVLKGRVDWAFLAAAAGLVFMGTLVLLSAASPISYYTQILQRHFIALALGGLLFLLGLGLNCQIFEDQAKAVYAIVLALLFVVLLIGVTQRGHKAWLALPYLTFQPAEMARVGVILVCAAYLDSRMRRIAEFRTVLVCLGIMAPVLILILKQPDFSTALTFFPILLGMLFCAGARPTHLLAVMGYGLVSLGVPLLYTACQIRFPKALPGSWPGLILQTSRPGRGMILVLGAMGILGFLAWRLSVMARLQVRAVFFVAIPVIMSIGFLTGVLINHQLKGYQRGRFAAYVAPRADIQGAAYHVHQSQIAVGSGGILGKGLFAGTQSQLGFLPERHTDFIYAVVGEEMGFLGTMGILSLYLLLIGRIVAAGRMARDRYGYLVCSGLATMLAFQLMLNVGMCLGLMPVAGIPLPLISYGGSSLVITLWSLGIVANIYSRRYTLL